MTLTAIARMEIAPFFERKVSEQQSHVLHNGDHDSDTQPLCFWLDVLFCIYYNDQ